MSTAVVLFTRDLRVHDQPALAAACAEAELVVPLFVFDEELLDRRCGSANRVSFLLGSLRDLDRSLRERGGRLFVRRGDVVEEAIRIAGDCAADSIHAGEDVSAYAQTRQRRLATACETERLRLRLFPGVTVVPPGELLPQGGDHYRVFTPYWRAWQRHPKRRPAPVPARIETPSGLRAGRLPALAKLVAERPSPNLAGGGESVALERLDRWLGDGLASYEDGHDDLAGDRTSRLSPHLHFGCVSPGTVLDEVDGRPGGEAFARQLCWRDFHHQVMAARPEMARADYRDRGRRWLRDERLEGAWRTGLTGYPIVDAGMRQLLREGFIHNRARMVVASFLAKTLGVDWRVGADHFAGLLVDADVASNIGNWQWVAGTGNDTRPNRVLNPLRQARRFDPAGEYVRRYVPELGAVEGRAVHEPWRLGALERAGLDYPEPLTTEHC